jgi:hypothetical protein
MKDEGGRMKAASPLHPSSFRLHPYSKAVSFCCTFRRIARVLPPALRRLGVTKHRTLRSSDFPRAGKPARDRRNDRSLH